MEKLGEDVFEYYGDIHTNHNSAQTKDPSMGVQVHSATDKEEEHVLQKIKAVSSLLE